MADKLPRIELYPGDWLRDPVSGCSLAAQGLWLRMMFIAHDSTRYGYLELNGSPMQPDVIARRCGCSDLAQYESLLSELTTAGVPSTSDNKSVYSRRMARDANLRAVRAKAGRKGGKQTAKQKRSKRSSKVPANPDSDTDNDIEDDIGFKGELSEPLDRADFRQALGRWLVYKGRKYKPVGLAALISRAANLASQHGVEAVISAMDKAMANDWKGWDQESSFAKPQAHRNGDAGDLWLQKQKELGNG